MGCPSFSFAPVEDDTDIAPILKVSAQFFVQVQTSADYYEEEHAYALVGRMVTAGEPARNHGFGREPKEGGVGSQWIHLDTASAGHGFMGVTNRARTPSYAPVFPGARYRQPRPSQRLWFAPQPDEPQRLGPTPGEIACPE